MSDCGCALRDPVTVVVNHADGEAEETLGLLPVTGNVWSCPGCGLRYRRVLSTAGPFRSTDSFVFTKLEGLATREVVVCRCPKCGSTNAFADESRSMIDLTYMQCRSCGEGGLVDSWQRDEDWYVEIEVPVDAVEVPLHVAPLAEGEDFYSSLQRPPTTTPRSFGCGLCFGEDAAAAWEASRHTRLRSVVEESHFGVQLTSCRCGQHFATVFTERVDWRGGEDEQDWLVLPLDADEERALVEGDANLCTRKLTEFGRERRFLVRSSPSSGGLSLWWRPGGLAIGRSG